MNADFVHYHLESGVAVITLDDGKVNALGTKLLAELDAALTRAEGEARAVVLAGRPGRFSAGFDLSVIMGGLDAARDLFRTGGQVMMRLYGCPLPTVAAVTGHALAGGALLVLCCDSRLAAAGAYKIGLNEVAIGLPLPLFAQRLAADRIDRRAFVAATLQATIYNPASAAEVGYVDRVFEVDRDALVTAATARARELTELSAHAYAYTKRRLRERVTEEILATLDSDLDAISGLGG